MRRDSSQSVWHWRSSTVSLYLAPPLCRLISPSLPPSPLLDYRPTAAHICSPLHLSLSRGWRRSKESVFCDPCSPGGLTRFWGEDVSQLLDDLLELQHCILFMLHIVSCRTHTQKTLSHLYEWLSVWWEGEDAWFHVQWACVCATSACRGPAASVSVVSLLAGSPWRPPPDTGEDRVDRSDPLASESSLGCFVGKNDYHSLQIIARIHHVSGLESHWAFHIIMNVIADGALPAGLSGRRWAESLQRSNFSRQLPHKNHQVTLICALTDSAAENTPTEVEVMKQLYSHAPYTTTVALKVQTQHPRKKQQHTEVFHRVFCEKVVFSQMLCFTKCRYVFCHLAVTLGAVERNPPYSVCQSRF